MPADEVCTSGPEFPLITDWPHYLTVDTYETEIKKILVGPHATYRVGGSNSADVLCRIHHGVLSQRGGSAGMDSLNFVLFRVAHAFAFVVWCEQPDRLDWRCAVVPVDASNRVYHSQSPHVVE